MTNTIVFDKEKFKAVSEAVAKLNGEQKNQFVMIDFRVVTDWHKLAFEADEKANLNLINLAFRVYAYLFAKRQNTTGQTVDEVRQKGMFVEFNQSAYMKIKTIADDLGYKKPDNILPALKLLSKMNLLICLQYKSGRYSKYAFFVLNTPNYILCHNFNSEFRKMPKK